MLVDNMKEIATKIISGTAILITLATGAQVTDYYLVKNVSLAGEKFTSWEHEQLRPELIQKMKGIPTYTEYQMFIDLSILRIEKSNFK